MELPIIAPGSTDYDGIRAAPDWMCILTSAPRRVSSPGATGDDDGGLTLRNLMREYDLDQSVVLACLTAVGVRAEHHYYDITKARAALDDYAPDEDLLPRSRLAKVAGGQAELAKALEGGIVRAAYRLGEREWYAPEAEGALRDWRRTNKAAALAEGKRLRAEASAARRAAKAAENQAHRLPRAAGGRTLPTWPDGLIASRAASALLNISREKLHALIEAGRVPVAQKMPGLKGAWLFDPSVLQRLHIKAPEGYLSTTDAASLVGRSTQCLSGACKRGAIPSLWENGQYFVRPEDARAYVEKVQSQRAALAARARRARKQSKTEPKP